jgi:hypothetical protein
MGKDSPLPAVVVRPRRWSLPSLLGGVALRTRLRRWWSPFVASGPSSLLAPLAGGGPSALVIAPRLPAQLVPSSSVPPGVVVAPRLPRPHRHPARCCRYFPEFPGDRRDPFRLVLLRSLLDHPVMQKPCKVSKKTIKVRRKHTYGLEGWPLEPSLCSPFPLWLLFSRSPLAAIPRFASLSYLAGCKCWCICREVKSLRLSSLGPPPFVGR